MFRKSVLTAAILLASGVSICSAQDAVLDELYGRGVHRFFANDYVQAHENFSLAIDNGSQDPRVYYFRGLAASASGRPEEAETDWRTGAMIEARGTFGTEVGRALARIQGATRLEIERIRQLARLQARSQQTVRNRARYEGAESAAPRPLRGANPGPAAPTPPPSSATPPPVAPSPAVPPPTTPPPAAVPPAPSPDWRNNPFADDGPGIFEGQPRIDSEDALSGSLEAAQPEPIAPAAAGTTNPPPATAPGTASPEADPFGAPTADPFGAGGDPFGGTPAEGDNPFGD